MLKEDTCYTELLFGNQDLLPLLLYYNLTMVLNKG